MASQRGSANKTAYAIVPGVQLTTTLGSDGNACTLNLQPRSKASAKTSRQHATFSSEIAERVLNQLAPANVRKGEPQKILSESGCSAILREDYDNVTITRVANECQPIKGNVQTLTIHWKRPACEPVSKSTWPAK